MGTRSPLVAGLAGQIWQINQPLLVEDYDTWPLRSPTFMPGQVHAVAAVPLQLGGRVNGVLGLAFIEPGRVFGPEELEWLSGMAQLTALAIDNARLLVAAQQELAERKRTEAGLRESEENFRTFFDTVDDMIFVGTQDGRIIYANPSVSRKLGYTLA